MNHKICFVSLFIYPLLDQEINIEFIGGAELQQLLIAKELAKRGYKLFFITMDHGQEKVRLINNFTVISAFKPGKGLPGIRFFYPRLFYIWQALRIANADIYYVRGAHHTLAPVVFYSRLFKKKVIFCGADDPDFHPERVRLPIFPYKMMYLWGLKRVDAFIAQNSVQRLQLNHYFNSDARIIYNGYPNVKIKISSKKEILWVANFRKPKNPHLFLELAKRIPEEKFVMIGGRKIDTDENGNNLFDTIQEKAKIVKNLEFKGFLPLNLVEGSFDRAKLFVNTSVHEGFPNTFLQAWSRGIPVISFVDPDDLIKTHDLGLVVSNIDEMAEKVKDVLRKKIVFSSSKIRGYFKRNLTITNITDQYECVFSSLY